MPAGYEVQETYIEIFENQDDSKLKIISSVILATSSANPQKSRLAVAVVVAVAATLS